MAEESTKPVSRRTEKIGNVVSTKMQKTIVVEVEMRKTHPKYKRVIKSSKKFYAHDEQNTARVGDVVRIKEMPSAQQAEALDAGRSDSPLLAAAGRRGSAASRFVAVVHWSRLSLCHPDRSEAERRDPKLAKIVAPP